MTETHALFEPVRTIRTFESAIHNIVVGIERARLRLGDRLPNETDLAEQLDISKPTLRQALRVLERSGLLIVKQGKAGGIILTSDYVPAEAISSNIAIEENTLLETLRARRVIETAIGQEAMLNATGDDLTEIERTVDLLLEVEIGRYQILSVDMMFHRAVARATHNRILEEALQVLYRHLGPIREAFRQSTEEATLVHRIHRTQLDAMISRNPARLAKALDDHFRYIEERYASSLGVPWSELFAQPRPRNLRASAHQRDQAARSRRAT